MKRATVHFGFEVQSGEAVALPLQHTVVTGQTQEAGKTTALEGLIARAERPAITFITKRGEGSFVAARRIAPYFREQADWQYVAAILEASRGEKLKYERAWIIRASKGARSLADVHRNVREKLAKRDTGKDADVYTVLDAYLEVVVPQIAATRWATTVELEPGLNVMDLTTIVPEMQHLVIRSTLEWVLNHAEGTLLVIPEAWKFIPQGRGTPVKLAAEAFIRQAAGLRNYLYLDSQDIEGVEKLILKSVPVWVLGVQREVNAIRRTLDQMPAGIKKPKPEAVATLGLGEFFVCHGTHVIHAYAQPAWMEEKTARAIARRELSIDDVEHLAPRRPRLPASRPPSPGHAPPALPTIHLAKTLRGDQPMSEQLEKTLSEMARTQTQILQFMQRGQSAQTAVDAAIAGGKPMAGGGGGGVATAETMDGQEEALYQRFKSRLLAEAPSLLRVLMSEPEIELLIEKHVIQMDGASVAGRVARLLHGGHFDSSGSSFSATLRALERTGSRVNNKTLSNALKDLVRKGFLTKEGEGYKAVPGMKRNVREADAS